MKLFHKTQRGGTIEHAGPPLKNTDPPAILPVDQDGFFEAPEPLAGCLLRVLHPDVIEAPATKGAKKGSEG